MTIPAMKRNFEKVELNNFVKLVYGEALTANKRMEGTVPVYGSNGIVGSHNQFLIDKKTIVVGRKGSVGKVHLTNRPCWVIDTAFYTDIDANIDLQYLFYFLSSLTNKLVFPKGVKPGINRQEYLKNLIALPLSNGKPDLNEQKRIANKLTALFAEIDKTIEKIEKQLSKADSLFHQSLKKAFIVKTAKQYKLSELAETTSGGTPNRSNKSYFGDEIPWLKSGELNDNRNIVNHSEGITKDGMRNSNAKLFPKGTLLLAMYGATAGKLGILGIEATTNQAVCAINPKENISTDYLYWYLFSERTDFLKKAFGGAQPNISQAFIKELPIYIPMKNDAPDIVAQNKITEKLNLIEKQIAELKTKFNIQKNQLLNLKQSLLNQAFEGKL